ncbi:MAG: hypothetical protein EOM80_01950 [Erysipelotrichia bacterium]|nr:hypothetical protein [Erysipelotrichia bacterium]
MNRWKRAAILCAIAAAMSNSSPVAAGLNRASYAAETAAINVAKHFPVNMATGVSPETPLTVEFGGAVNQSFYQTVNFNLFNGTEPVEGELFYNPSARQVMFKSRQPLGGGQTYTAQLSYYDGLGRTSEKVWSFQTAAAGLSQAPTSSSVPSVQIANQATEKSLVLTNANMGNGSIRADMPMEISFSEPIDVVSLKSAPVQLFEDNRPVGIDYRLSRDMKTITVSPRTALKEGSSYAIAVEKSLSSTTGSRLHKKTLIPFKFAGNFDEPQIAINEIEERPAQNIDNNEVYDNPFAEATQAPVSRPKAQTAKRPAAKAALQMVAQPVAEPVQIVGMAPQNGSRVSNLTQPVTIAFSEEIKPETLNEFTFRLEDDFGPVPAKIHYFKGNKQATLTPVGLLDSNKNYRIVVTQGITDFSGKPIRSGINSMFTTSSPNVAPAMPQISAKPAVAPQRETEELEGFESNYEDPMAAMSEQAENIENFRQRPNIATGNVAMKTASAKAPADKRVRNGNETAKTAQGNLKAFKVTSIFPGADTNNVARKAKIAVHFSEPADPRTVNNINISVFGNQVRVDGKVTYDRQQNRAIFEPSNQLDAKTEYKVIISDKIRSRMGEQLTQRFSWQFATTGNSRNQYLPTQKTAEADAAFFIPLVDSKLKKNPGQGASIAQKNMPTTNGSFSFVSPRHWAFKSVKHITNKGILNAFPFVYTDNVTRYEFASAINNALGNLKSMQHMSSRPRLKVADMVQLEQLVIEFRNELKSYGVNTAWFESFLQQQGVNLQQVELKVKKLNS